ncbi:pyridoxamine 5'-phosphate oxidase family protein [Rhodococcus gannanensis]|uniref:Pyridoxamine 5'-phosphate oxidase family protein n=1 Tax=Rhodococcus gannanensis TaxID=1960308 RepID=A0ABW4P275_9NOCA
MTEVSVIRSVTTVDQLEALYGERPPVTMLKAIPFLDDHCRTFLQRSPFAVLGAQGADGTQRSLVVGGEPGVMTAADRNTLRIESPCLPGLLGDGAPGGMVALVPGYGETLRVNGRLHRDGTAAVLRVDEAYLHCARSVTRSGLWNDVEARTAAAPGADLADPHVREFLARSRFLTITSTDAGGGTDVSPKGDEAGFLVPLGPRTLAFPDRPGNRRTDTLRNLLQHPEVSLLSLVAGDDRVLHVQGRATITDDPGLRTRLAAGLAEPELVVVVDVDDVDLRPDPALATSRLWNPDARGGHADLPKAGQIWTDHLALDNVN